MWIIISLLLLAVAGKVYGDSDFRTSMLETPKNFPSLPIITNEAATQFSMPAAEYNALSALYFDTGGPSQWVFIEPYSRYGYPWNFTASPYEDKSYQLNPCNALFPWQGLKCSSDCEGVTCNVLSIILPEIGLVGTLPSSLMSLSALLRFDASSNYLTGTVPSWLQALSSLVSLKLGDNSLIGTIPAISSNGTTWTDLVEFELQENLLTGTIPQTIGELQSLQKLSLYRNYLVGSIPESLSMLWNLQSILLHRNSLNGTLPSSLSTLQNISTFDIGRNKIHGTVPAWMSNWSNLTMLVLTINRFEGSLSSSLFVNWKQLQYLEISANLFTSSIPDSFCNLEQLSFLDLSVNGFTGNVPTACNGKLPNLEILRISFNKFTGSLPYWLDSCSRLKTILLRGNLYHGSFPDTYAALPNLQLLDVRYNTLTGTLPPEILQAWTSLRSIALDYNEFYGPLPDCFEPLDVVQGISLNLNQFTGTVPPSLNYLSNLTFFGVSQNYMHGTLPVLHNIAKIEVVTLQNNSFSGPLVGKLPYSPFLKDLDVSNNYFSGSLRGLLSPEQNQIEVVNVGTNQFTGRIPFFGGNRTKAVYLNGNAFTGTLPDYTFQTSPHMRMFIATENCLTGTLSEHICKVQNLYEFVIAGLHSAPLCKDRIPLFNTYMISKGVGGTLPSCIFKLPFLSILHVSGNTFSGTLPNKGYSSVTNLTSVHLSNNVFSGSLPEAFWKHNYADIDMSFNRFKGSIPASYAPDMKYVDRMNGSLVLNINRLSGSIPDVLEHFPSINILDGNMFSCRSDRSDLPVHDPQRHSYICGSTSTDYSIYAVACATVLVILICLGSEHNRNFVKQYYRWFYLSDANDSLQKVLFSFQVLFIRIFRMIGIFTILCFIYIGLSSGYSTYTRAYIWTVSSTYLQGLTPALILLFLFLQAIAATMLFDYSRPVTPVVFTQLHSLFFTKWKVEVSELWIMIAFSVCSVVIVASVNYGYVRAIYENYTSQEMIMISLAMSMFKLAWSTVVVMGPVRWKIEQMFNLHFSEEALTWVAVINNVIVPYVVELIASPDCFHYAVSSPPVINTEYLDIVCQSSLVCTDADGGACRTIIVCPIAAELTVNTLYNSVQVSPPFVYSFQCSSAVLSGFAYIFAIRYAVNIFITPLIFFVMKSLVVCDPVKYGFMTKLLPPLWRPIVFLAEDKEKESSNLELDLVNERNLEYLATFGNIEAKRLRQYVVVRAVLDTSILLAFGLLFPPLGIIIGFSMMKDLINIRSSIGRLVYLQRHTKSQTIRDNLSKFFENFESQLRGWNDIVMSQLTAVLLVVAYPLGLNLFDTLGGEVGALTALWILIVMAFAPSWISLIIYCSGKFMSLYSDGENGSIGIFGVWSKTDNAVNEHEAVEMGIRESEMTYYSESSTQVVENPLNIK